MVDGRPRETVQPDNVFDLAFCKDISDEVVELISNAGAAPDLFGPSKVRPHYGQGGCATGKVRKLKI